MTEKQNKLIIMIIVLIIMVVIAGTLIYLGVTLSKDAVSCVKNPITYAEAKKGVTCQCFGNGILINEKGEQININPPFYS